VTTSATEFDLQLASGRIRARRVGSPTAPLVLLLHGLSAHLHSFDFLVDRLAGRNLQLVAVDLRGRGRSEITAAGTYGLDAHSRDVLEIATLLGAQQFDLVGWSMGALVGIGVAALAPQRLRRLVLIDHAGNMDAGPIDKITKGLDRLELAMDQPQTYLDAIRLGGGIKPWSPFWDNYYGYELQPCRDGFKATTSKMACLEDLNKLMHEDFPAMWKHLSMPTLLIRCLVPVGAGFIVPEAERDSIKQVVPHIRIEELEVDHYIVMVSEETAALIGDFLN
jgi:pimeloyl-ACP methyl ester carboxylesterase